MTISFGIGTIFALFDTSGTIPSFKDTPGTALRAVGSGMKTDN
jgi:hypothetical protein